MSRAGGSSRADALQRWLVAQREVLSLRVPRTGTGPREDQGLLPAGPQASMTLPTAENGAAERAGRATPSMRG